MLSGVPQGNVLGPLLFLLFVNELPSWIMSDMKMFAYDMKVCCRIDRNRLVVVSNNLVTLVTQKIVVDGPL